MLKWYLLSEIRVIYIRESEGGADRQTNRHTNNINWGSVNSAVGPFEAFSLEFALGLEVTMWLSAVSFSSSSSVSCSHWHLATRYTNLLAYTIWDSTQLSEGEGRGADLSFTPFICTNIDQSRYSLHVWGFSRSTCDHVSGVPGCWNSGCGQC